MQHFIDWGTPSFILLMTLTNGQRLRTGVDALEYLSYTFEQAIVRRRLDWFLVVEAVVDILVMEQKSVRRWNDTESNNETMTNGQMNEKLT